MDRSIGITRPLANKKIDSFYVSFFGMENNESNILGRQVQSIERPSLTFNVLEVRNKGIKYENTSRIEYQAITITFLDDNASLVQRSLIEQVKKQTHVNATQTLDPAFQIGVKCYSVEGKVVEEFELQRCYIQNITNSEFIMTDGTNNIISVTITFNKVDYNFPILEEVVFSLLVDHEGNAIVDYQDNYIVG